MLFYVEQVKRKIPYNNKNWDQILFLIYLYSCKVFPSVILSTEIALNKRITSHVSFGCAWVKKSCILNDAFNQLPVLDSIVSKQLLKCDHWPVIVVKDWWDSLLLFGVNCLVATGWQQKRLTDYAAPNCNIVRNKAVNLFTPK